MRKSKRIIIPRGRQGIKGEKGEMGDGATTLGPKLDLQEGLTSQNLIYWDAVNGNDANTGTTHSPVQTAERVCELLISGVTNTIVLRSDVVWDYYLDIQNDIKIDISGGPSTRFSITFVDAINNETKKGGIRTEAYGTLVLLYAKLLLGGTNTGSVFDANIGKWKCRSFVVDFEILPNSSGYFFSNLYAGELVVYFQGGDLSNASGHFFEGVAAGQDPNDRALVYCNKTTN